MSKKRKSPLSTSSGAGGKSIFAALSKLEDDDVKAAKSRRKATAASASRSLAARVQTGISGDLVQCRILLQRAIGEASESIGTSSVEEGEGNGDDAVVSSADGLLVKLLEARRSLCHNTMDTDGTADYSDLLVDDNDNEGALGSILENSLTTEYDQCRSEWKDVFNRRHHDLRLHAGLTAKTASKFRVMDQSFWDQVESTAAHERLMRASQGSRKCAGDDASTDDNDSPIATNTFASSKPLFDDSKVYQHMLRDFVSLGASAKGGGSAGAGLAADAAAERLRRAAQKKNGQSGKDVDRKASKGRKIRYTVNPKLENFAFPISRPVPSIGEDIWFRSLFGGAGRKQLK